ncbi:MAG: hypothetical protein U0359_07255 [Byssovorax sp.]
MLKRTILVRGSILGCLVGALWALADCKTQSTPPGGSGGSSSDAGEGDAKGGGATGGSTGGTGGTIVIPDDAGNPDGSPPVVEETPTTPKDDAGNTLDWPDATLLEGVMVAPNRDSVKVLLPIVPGAKDYRVFFLPAGVSIQHDADGHETVLGTTITCAGFRQHNAPAGMLELVRKIEVTGLTGETRLVVEAIDTPCPFAGVMGNKHADIDVQNPEVDPPDRGVFSIYTEPEIVQGFGSLILNGHAKGAHVGAPAPLVAPKVLGRTTIKVTPLGLGDKPVPFFQDFAQKDQPALVSQVPVYDRSQNGLLFQNSELSFYSYGSTVTQMFIDRGRLHTLLADWEQDIFSSNVIYPKKPVALSASDYLHVTFEVASDATQRRYVWLVLCGAKSAGATMSADGKLLGSIIQTPFFYQDDGLNPSYEGWNCLQIFPRDGSPFPLPPDDTNPESDIRVMVNLPDKAIRESVVNVSPPMYPPGLLAAGWYRQRDGQGQLVAPILDDQMLIAPSTHYDVFIRRDRVVLFVEGEQRLCNDFPSVALTMAEGALGFGQVLYHSAAERGEFSAPYWDRTGQRYYLEDTPFIDARAWDNLGYAEHVAAPPSFDASSCYVYAP